MSDASFDITVHQRERIRDLEQRLAGKTKDQQTLVRLLGLAVQVAAGQDCSPLTLLTVFELIDDQRERGPSIDELVQVLRDTDPDALKKRAAAA